MASRKSNSQPTWTDTKQKLSTLDRPALVGLIQELYAAHPDNRTFLHSRFGLGGEVLKPYKETIARWVWPDVLRKQDVSVAKAKQAIANYRKAVGNPSGLAELMVFYCEQASGFCVDIWCEDESYLNALCRMFERALMVAKELPARERKALIARLDRVRTVSSRFGYGVDSDMDSSFARYVDLPE